MSVFKPRGSRLFVYDFQLGGHRFHGPTGATTERAARTIEAQRREEAAIDAAQRTRIAAQLKGKAPLTIDIAADRYWIEAGKHRANAADLERDLARLVEFFGKETLLSDIGDSDVARMVAWRRGHFRWGKQKHGLISPSQVNRSATEVLQRVFTRAVDVWKAPLPDAPDFSQHMLDEPQERVRELAPAEDAALTAEIDEDYERVRQFSLASGLRQKASLLRWSEVDFIGGAVTVVSKGGKRQRLPMTPRMREMLVAAHGHHDDAVFTYRAKRTVPKKQTKGKRYPITVSGLKTHWRRARVEAGVKDYRWHDNRHTFATNLLRETQNLKLVKIALNHARLEETDKYAHVLDDELRAGMVLAERNRDAKSQGRSQGSEMKEPQTPKRRA